MRLKRVLFGYLGHRLDTGVGPNRWNQWRPTIADRIRKYLARFDLSWQDIDP